MVAHFDARACLFHAISRNKVFILLSCLDFFWYVLDIKLTLLCRKNTVFRKLSWWWSGLQPHSQIAYQNRFCLEVIFWCCFLKKRCFIRFVVKRDENSAYCHRREKKSHSLPSFSARNLQLTFSTERFVQNNKRDGNESQWKLHLPALVIYSSLNETV